MMKILTHRLLLKCPRSSRNILMDDDGEDKTRYVYEFKNFQVKPADNVDFFKVLSFK